VADLSAAADYIVAQGGEAVGAVPWAVSVGMRLSDAIVDLHSPDERREESLYWHHVYRVVTPALDFAAQRICQELQTHGYRALPIPASLRSGGETLTSVFSHKLAAHLAGLGWIGKNSLLISPEFGSRVRWVTVLTDAPLVPGEPADRECGRCRACVAACPVQAFTGAEFRSHDPVEVRFDTRACDEYRRTHPCGLCVAACPIGRRKR
jgi:epoxyqueuosine reductase QueG